MLWQLLPTLIPVPPRNTPLLAFFDTGFSGSFSNDNVYIGGTSYQNAADEALKQFDPKSKEAFTAYRTPA